MVVLVVGGGAADIAVSSSGAASAPCPFSIWASHKWKPGAQVVHSYGLACLLFAETGMQQVRQLLRSCSSKEGGRIAVEQLLVSFPIGLQGLKSPRSLYTIPYWYLIRHCYAMLLDLSSSMFFRTRLAQELTVRAENGGALLINGRHPLGCATMAHLICWNARLDVHRKRWNSERGRRPNNRTWSATSTPENLQQVYHAELWHQSLLWRNSLFPR